MSLIKCGGMEVPINLTDIDDNGEYLPNKEIININKDLPREKQERCVAHETLHLRFNVSGVSKYLESINADEEVIIAMLENTEYLFLKENTTFFD